MPGLTFVIEAIPQDLPDYDPDPRGTGNVGALIITSLNEVKRVQDDEEDDFEGLIINDEPYDDSF